MKKPLKIVKIKPEDKKEFSSFVETMRSEPYLGLEQVVSSDKWLEEGIKADKSKRGAFYVSKTDHKITGYCYLFRNVRKNDRWEVGFGVLPDYRQKGLASALLGCALGSARQFGAKEVYAGVKKENKQAQEFLEFNKFTIDKKTETSIQYKIKLK